MNEIADMLAALNFNRDCLIDAIKDAGKGTEGHYAKQGTWDGIRRWDGMITNLAYAVFEDIGRPDCKISVDDLVSQRAVYFNLAEQAFQTGQIEASTEPEKWALIEKYSRAIDDVILNALAVYCHPDAPSTLAQRQVESPLN